MGDDDTPGPLDEWSEEIPTRLDGVVAAPIDDVTKPHDLVPVLEEARMRGRDEGCRACFEEGLEEAWMAVRAVFYEGGWKDEVVEQTIARFKAKVIKL